jgi:hypothetical protein
LDALLSLGVEAVVATGAGFHGADPDFVGASGPVGAGVAGVFFASGVVAAAQFALWSLDDERGVASAAVDFESEFIDGLGESHDVVGVAVAEAEAFIAGAIAAVGDAGNGGAAACGATDGGCFFVAELEGFKVRLGDRGGHAGEGEGDACSNGEGTDEGCHETSLRVIFYYFSWLRKRYARLRTDFRSPQANYGFSRTFTIGFNVGFNDLWVW